MIKPNTGGSVLVDTCEVTMEGRNSSFIRLDRGEVIASVRHTSFRSEISLPSSATGSSPEWVCKAVLPSGFAWRLR